jgi:hypothetical protein
MPESLEICHFSKLAHPVQSLGHAAKYGRNKFQNTLLRRPKMNNYNPSSLRNSVAAAICTVLFSATCLIGAVGPAQAAGTTASPAPVIAILA